MTQQPDDVTADDVKVLYLAGKGRSGSTLLAGMLGQLPGFFNAAEVLRLWDEGIVHNYRCGCGLPLTECPTWRAILDEADTLLAGSGIPPLAEARIDLDQAAVARWPLMIRLLRAKPGVHPGWSRLDRYVTAASAVYQAIARVTGARVIVDSSKIPIEPVALGLVPGVDLRIAQVVRDPRAVVYSWRRSRVRPDRDHVEYMPRFSASFSTTSWLARNLVVDLIRKRAPFTRVLYDDMASDPAAVLRRLADLVDEPVGDLAFLTSRTATLAPTHSAPGGNPVRMSSGEIVIEPDDEWRSHMSRRDRLVSTAIALPLLHRYDMPIRRTRTEPGSRTVPMPVLTTNGWLRFDAIRRDLRIAGPRTVLEIGAGEGALGAWLARQYDYTGNELDQRSRAAAQDRIAAAGRGQIVDQLEDLADRQFDLVCAFEVLEHIADDRKALEQWRALLRADGWLLLSVPAHASHFSVADELVGHYRRYERQGLTDLLHESGFEVVRLESYGAGLGHVLERGRKVAARRIMARRGAPGATPEERTSGSGRLFQPKGSAVALAFATIAAPGRLAQLPFRAGDVGTGYVVLARRVT